MSEAAVVIPRAAVCAGIVSYGAAVWRNCGAFVSSRLDAACTFLLGISVMYFSRSGLTSFESLVLGIGTLSNVCVASYLALRVFGFAGYEWSERDARHHLYLNITGLAAHPAAIQIPAAATTNSNAGERAALGALQYDDIRALCEREHWGEFVVMEPQSRQYFFAKSSLEAAKIALKHFDGRPGEVVRVGGPSRISGISVQ
jgi:hypothetical protein